MSPPSPIRAVLAPAPAKGPVMGVFLASSSSSTAPRTIIPSKTKRVLFPPKSKLSRKSPGKKMQLSTSPTGFFTHPSFNMPSISRRRELVLSPTRGVKANARSGVMKTIEQRARVAGKKIEKGGRRLDDKGKKNTKDSAERDLPSRPLKLVLEADDVQTKIASSSTGLHPSSDPAVALHDLFSPDSRQENQFDDVLEDLPPSSPPVFGLANLSDAVDSSPVIRAVASSSSNSVSSVRPASHDAPTSSPVAVSRKRKSHPPPLTPPARSHPAQKLKVSARTLAAQGDDLPVVKIAYDGTYALVLGRSRRALTTSAKAEPVELSTDVQPVPTTLSRAVSDKLLPDAATKEGRLAPLPRSASHASRAHVLLQVVPAQQQGGERLVVSILGQNGCKIRQLPFPSAVRKTTEQAKHKQEAGRRYPVGSEVDFSRSRDEKTIRLEVDMYSCRAIIDWLPGCTDESANTLDVETDIATIAPAALDDEAEYSPVRTPVPSAEPIAAVHNIDAQLSELLRTPVVRKSSSSTGGGKRARTYGSLDNIPVTPESVRSIHSQMTYDSSASLSEEEEEAVMEDDDDEDEDDEHSALPSDIAVDRNTDTREIKQEIMDAYIDPQAVLAASPAMEGTDRKNSGGPDSTETPAVPADIDFKALVATSLVFSGSSAISCPDLVKAILDSQPSMKSYGKESVWSVWVENTLDSHPMFGRVDRKGKDASGKPLLPLFHYVPAEDYDRTRAAELGGLMRPLRGTQRGGGKAIDWRPVGGRRR